MNDGDARMNALFLESNALFLETDTPFVEIGALFAERDAIDVNVVGVVVRVNDCRVTTKDTPADFEEVASDDRRDQGHCELPFA